MNTRFIYMADVFCPWCYGFGPVMKRISQENPQIPVSVVGGNLISRPMTLAEDLAANPDLVDFWKSVEKTVGRPLTGAINAALAGKPLRLYSPGADEILVALREFAPGHELDQLLYLEDLFYLKGVDMFTQEALAQIAARWKIPAGQFDSALDSQAALEATSRNLAEAVELLGEAGSYPSLFLVKDSDVYVVSRGFVQYETAASRLSDILRGLNAEPIAHLGCSYAENCTAGAAKH